MRVALARHDAILEDSHLGSLAAWCSPGWATGWPRRSPPPVTPWGRRSTPSRGLADESWPEEVGRTDGLAWERTPGRGSWSTAST